MSDQSGETVDQAVARTENRYRAAQSEYEALPRSAPKPQRIELLHLWNHAARDYFSACVAALGSQTSEYAGNAPMWAADWLRYAAVHYAAIRREIDTKNLGLDFERLKPGLVKFDEFQRLVKDPAIARDLRIELIEAGLSCVRERVFG